MTPQEALKRVLDLTGASFPRGVLGPETRALGAALQGVTTQDVAELAGRAAAVHWPELRAPIEAALLRGRAVAGPEDQEAFAIVLRWAADEDPDNPLARSLAVRGAAALWFAEDRAREVLRAAESSIAEGGAPAAVAAATAAGAMALGLLDLDPEDFEPEITAYVGAGRRDEDIAELARSTGDAEIRAWARAAVAGIDEPEAPEAAAGVRHLAAGPPPADPAEDLVWVPAILALVEAAIERALVDEAAEGGDG
ncbi:MAG: hypothetical protein AB7V42_10055 [Thermoleophilia bacterium]